MIWVSTPRYTVGLIVHNGGIVDAPPVARWTLRKPARLVWDRFVAQGATVRWVP